MSFLVPVLVVVWLCNPIGGQTSLRVVTKAPNITNVDAPVYYFDKSNTEPLGLTNAAVLASNSAFNTALFTPPSSKNGTQDIFGNLQIPMIESLRSLVPDSEGWYSMTKEPEDLNESADQLVTILTRGAKNLPRISNPVYAGLTGLPFLATLQDQPDGTSQITNRSSLSEVVLQALQGPTVVSVESAFNIETSYMYLDCSIRRITTNGTNTRKTTYTSRAIVSNGGGLTLSIDSGVKSYLDAHNMNSTKPRRIGLQSWGNGLGSEAKYFDGPGAPISDVKCDLTTTYIEAKVYCPHSSNCSIEAVRDSKKPPHRSYLTAFDGITLHPDNDNQQLLDITAAKMSALFFAYFVNSTGSILPEEEERLSEFRLPLEYYFVDPVNPFRGRDYQHSKQQLYEIGNTIFSQRFTQLLNTYWQMSTAPFDMTGSFTPPNTAGRYTETTGKVRITTTVLKCNIPYFIVLVAISVGLFLIGLTTAYLDATRRGPDVLDNFVNSLRHSPYIHVDHGPSLEDGKEKAQRLRRTVIKMGDVAPEDPVGFVAIATPNDQQPVARIQPQRHYS